MGCRVSGWGDPSMLVGVLQPVLPAGLGDPLTLPPWFSLGPDLAGREEVMCPLLLRPCQPGPPVHSHAALVITLS